MKTLLKFVPLVVLVVFSNSVMAEFNFKQFETNAEKVLNFFESIKRHKPIESAKIDEAVTSINQISKQISLYFDNANDLEATEVWLSISDHTLFDTGRIYMSDSDPRGKALVQIYEKIDAVSSRGKEIQLRFMEEVLPAMETDLWPELEETTKIVNKGGVKIVADFYASSKNANFALSPPNMVTTYSALAHIAKGKTKGELQKLLSLEGNEKPAFEKLNNYLMLNTFLYKPEEPQAYWSAGLWLINRSSQPIYELDFVNEMRENFGARLAQSDFTTSEMSACGETIRREFSKSFLANHSLFFPRFTFVHKNFGQELMGLNTVYKVAKPNRNSSIVVYPIAGVMDTLPDREMTEDDEPFEGETLPFSFDGGKRSIDFFKVEVKEHQTLTINGQPGYRFQLGVGDLMVVKCNNGAALKQLAKAITNDGLQIQPGRKVSRPAMLHIPEVDFDTEFNLLQYAQAKGLSTPFTRGKAEYTLGSDDKVVPGVYCSDAKIECTFMLDCYGIVSWQHISPDAVLRALPRGRDQRLPDNIIIDSPYLVMLTERKLGTVLGMAFIANPEKSEARKEHDEERVFMQLVDQPGQTTPQRQPQIQRQPPQRPQGKDMHTDMLKPSTALKLSTAMNQANLPQYVAPGIKMVANDYVPPNTVQFTYVVEQLTKDNPLVKSISQELKAALIEDLKKSNSVDTFREQKVNLIYVYNDTENNELFRVRIDHGEY